MTASILVVEDEPSIQELIAVNLARHGHAVTRAATAEEAYRSVAETLPDVILLDWMLPDAAGPVITRRLRTEARTREVPIIMLTARAGEDDKVAGLESGADDYITKPFSPEELLARVRAALRRALGQEQAVRGQLTAGSIAIDLERRDVMVAGREVHLTPKEFDLLSLLAARAGQVVTHRAILRAIWGPHSVDQPEHLRVLVGQLRKKIEDDPARPTRLLTEPWVGYRLAD